jgi:hypothetical protein
MTALDCSKTGCTVSATGVCLLSYADPAGCPNIGSRDDGTEKPPPADAQSPVLRTDIARRFFAGFELGVEDAMTIMRARYAHVIGVLGDTNAGKTSFLLSLYLMASSGRLPQGYQFSGSMTLPGFEARAHHIRRWRSGPIPRDLADHTSLSDPRQPAFLHLGIDRLGEKNDRLELLFTDLPGEWTRELINRAASGERMSFLRRADGIILVIDATQLESDRRHSEIQNSKHLLSRLSQTIRIDPATPIVILVAKCDELQGKVPSIVEQLRAHGESLGFFPQIVNCAAFSTIPAQMPHATGVFESVSKIIGGLPSTPLAKVATSSSAERAFLGVF